MDWEGRDRMEGFVSDGNGWNERDSERMEGMEREGRGEDMEGSASD